MIQHIAFDFDGTLGTAKDLSVETLKFIFQKVLHKTAPIEQFKAFTGLTVKEKLHRLDSINGELLFEEWGTFYKVHFLDYLKIYDGMIDTIKMLDSKGIHLSILSNKKDEFIRMGLRKFGILQYFKEIYSVDNLPQAKPSQEAIKFVLNQSNIKKETFLLVGDSLVDYETCKNGGVQFGLANWCGKNLGKIIEKKPDYIFNSPGDILYI